MSCRLVFSAWVVLILSACLCAQGVDFQITTESLPPGQQGNVYAVAFNATGGRRTLQLENFCGSCSFRNCDEYERKFCRHAYIRWHI